MRIASANCGSNTWAQNFSYDAMGNINNQGVGNATSYNAAYSLRVIYQHIDRIHD